MAPARRSSLSVSKNPEMDATQKGEETVTRRTTRSSYQNGRRDLTTEQLQELPEKLPAGETLQEPQQLRRSRRLSSTSSNSVKQTETQLEADSDPKGNDVKVEASKPKKRRRSSSTRFTSKKSKRAQAEEKKVRKKAAPPREPYCKPPDLPTILEFSSEDESAPQPQSPLIQIQRPRNNPLNGSVCNTGLKYVGAHVSAQGGVENAVHNALAIGAKSFALFLRPQRQWEAKPLDEGSAERFRTAMKAAGFAPHLVLPHGSYLLNLGAPKKSTLAKSRATLKDEMERCRRLGLTRYNFHPGSSCGEGTKEDCLQRIAESINQAHREVPDVMLVLENMAGQGNTVGGNFLDLRFIISMVRDKTRLGVCLDTCHAFAAGYDLSTEEGYESMMLEFERTVGMEYLVALHLNDSKGDLGSHLDRHENIGKGKLGKDTFQRIMRDPRLNDLPLILETPCSAADTYEKEICLLHSLQVGEK